MTVLTPPKGKPLDETTRQLARVTGGCGPYTVSNVSGLPLTSSVIATGLMGVAVQGDALNITGKTPLTAAHPAQTAGFWNPSALMAQAVTGPLPQGRDYPVTFTVTDSAGNSVTKTVTWHVDPLKTNVSVLDACACFAGTQVCDMHLANLGPDVLPQASVQIKYSNASYQSELQPSEIHPPDSNAAALGNGTATKTSDGVTFTNGTTIVPAGGEYASWPLVLTGSSAVPGRTITVTLPYSIDTSLSDNTISGSYDLGCSAKVAAPDGPVCKDDEILYVIAVGKPAATKLNLEDVLDPCLDPATVRALSPSQCSIAGNKITCTNVPTQLGMPAMISFSVKPKADCAVGTIIKNKATATFPSVDPPNNTPVTTDETQNRFCPCNDKSETCGASSASSNSSSRSSSSSSSSSRSSAVSSSRSSASSTVSTSTSRASSSSSRSSSRSSASAASAIGGSSLSSTASVLSVASQASSVSSAGETSSVITVSDLPSPPDENWTPIPPVSNPDQLEQPNQPPQITLQPGDENIDELLAHYCDGKGCTEEIEIFCAAQHKTCVPAAAPQCFNCQESNAPVLAMRDAQLCGNAALNIGEECDDGNLLSGDGCSAECRSEAQNAWQPVQALPATIFDMGFRAGAPDSLPVQPLAQPIYTLPQQSYIEAKGKGPTTTDSGPETILLMAGGAATGLAWIRRRRL